VFVGGHRVILVIFVLHILVFVDNFDGIVQMLLLNVLLDILEIVVVRSILLDTIKISFKIEEIPVINNIIPKNNNVFFFCDI
jgi:hypothetical protein